MDINIVIIRGIMVAVSAEGEVVLAVQEQLEDGRSII